jgi:hypothetical protein
MIFIKSYLAGIRQKYRGRKVEMKHTNRVLILNLKCDQDRDILTQLAVKNCQLLYWREFHFFDGHFRVTRIIE